jgi:hypothetical protein
LASVLVLVALAVSAPTPASGQVDPYSSSTTATTAPPGCTVTLSLSVTSGPVGTTVEATATCYTPGLTVEIRFDGQTVATERATPGGDGAAALGNRPLAVVGRWVSRLFAQADPSAGITVRFVVPPVPLGAHEVCAVATGAETVCRTFTVTPASASRGAGGGTSTFARTGVFVVPLLIAGVAAIVVGRSLRSRARPRRRRRG